MKAERTVDLNADKGESDGRWVLWDDIARLELVTSVDVGCVFQAGDPTIPLRTVQVAAERGVAVAAQVAHPDLMGFSRPFIGMPAQDLSTAVRYQMGPLGALCRSLGTSVRCVKPHGALKNSALHHDGERVAAIGAYDVGPAVLGPPGCVLLSHSAEAGVRTGSEALADRAHTRDGTRVLGDSPATVLCGADVVAKLVVRQVEESIVVATDGSKLGVWPKSACPYGDLLGVIAIARMVRAYLLVVGMSVRSLARGGHP